MFRSQFLVVANASTSAMCTLCNDSIDGDEFLDCGQIVLVRYVGMSECLRSIESDA